MNCREFETTLVLRLLEPLPPETRAALDAHRAVCRRCAARFEKAGRLPVLLPRESGPAPAEPASSRVEVFTRLEKTWAPKPRAFKPRFVWAAAGAVGFLLAGIVIGVGLLRPDRAGPELAAIAPGNVFRAYVERLEPVLLDFQLKGNEQAPKDLIEFEKRMTAELRRETTLLKEAALLTGQSDLVELLDEIDMLLVNITHLQAGDKDAAQQLRRLIQEKRQAWVLSLQSFGTTL